jgi:hypothetical protein
MNTWLLNNQGDFDGFGRLEEAAMAQAKENLKCPGVIGNTSSFGTVSDFSNEN